MLSTISHRDDGATFYLSNTVGSLSASVAWNTEPRTPVPLVLSSSTRQTAANRSVVERSLTLRLRAVRTTLGGNVTVAPLSRSSRANKRQALPTRRPPISSVV